MEKGDRMRDYRKERVGVVNLRKELELLGRGAGREKGKRGSELRPNLRLEVR